MKIILEGPCLFSYLVCHYDDFFMFTMDLYFKKIQLGHVRLQSGCTLNFSLIGRRVNLCLPFLLSAH